MPDTFSDRDVEFMRRALRLARRGEGRVEPNPMVGCVLAKRDQAIAEGFHRRYGGPHAEVEALRRASDAARGATAYVTLEPCSHFGKTPPCADALIEAGVKRVVAAVRDPFPAVSGRGLRKLRRAGIRVQTGLLADEAAELLAPFLTRVLLERPYVIAKWAQSADGKTATHTGDSKWISGPEARQLVHRLRARVDAVAVGMGTVLKDDPMLNARDVPIRRNAARVVFDSRLRIPPGAKLVQTAQETPTLILTVAATKSTAVQRRRKMLEKHGVRILTCRAHLGRVDPADALRKLVKEGFTNILVEGGGELLGSFADAGLVDELHLYTAPLIIGGDAPTGCGGAGAERMAQTLRGRIVSSRRCGDDSLTIIRFTTPPGRSK